MLKLNLNSDDLLKLVECCSKSGVLSLRLKDLELTFGCNRNETTQVSQPPAVIAEAEAKASEIEFDSYRKAEKDLQKEEIELMMLKDPSAYEEMVVAGELVDEETQD